jgi:hypothetical protein
VNENGLLLTKWQSFFVRKNMKTYYQKNKKRLLANAKIYYNNNKEKALNSYRKRKGYTKEIHNQKECACCKKVFIPMTRKNIYCSHDCWKKINKPAKPVKVYQYKKQNAQYHRYKLGARRRNIVFNLTHHQFYSFWQKPCTYCGGKINKVGLDRIDNNLGYSFGNINPCCTICNSIKGSRTMEEFRQHLKSRILKLEAKIAFYKKIEV